jgi:hypothetical protein
MVRRAHDNVGRGSGNLAPRPSSPTNGGRMSARTYEFPRQPATRADKRARDGAELPAEIERLDRGVYKARWTIDGYPVLYAVRSNGDRLPSLIVLRWGVSESDAWHRLRRRLDRKDPVGPRLEG